MRKDIEIHSSTNDVSFKSRRSVKLRPFKWVDNATGLSRYAYGEVDIPASISEASVRDNGFCIEIPYTPIYKEFMLRVRRVQEDGTYIPVNNKVNGSEWFTVKSAMYGKSLSNIHISRLILVSEEGRFYVKLNGESANLYSSNQTDFNIVKADRQNGNCLLECAPTNNYRYPVTGVGLVKWLNSNNVSDGELAETIKREFNEDGMVPKNVTYDYETKQMHFDVETINDN